MKTHYVLGFAFDEDCEKVVLIEKLKPEWQKGKLNGVGGKIEEDDENIDYAMSREFEEETGVKIHAHDWDHFATMIFKDAVVQCFRVFSQKSLYVKTIESEEIKICQVDDIRKLPVIMNLRTLIPMAINTEFSFANIDMS